MDGIQLSLFGKTYPELSPQTGERTSDASLKNSQKSAKRGVFSTSTCGRKMETRRRNHGRRVQHRMAAA